MAQKRFRDMTPEEREAHLAARKAANGDAPEPQDETEDEVREPDEAPPVQTRRSFGISTERRAQLLQGIPADVAALIDDDELAEIERQEQKAAEQERKKQAIADVRAALRQKARVENDLIPSSVLRSEEENRRLQEPVTFKINLPEGGGALGLRVNGFNYQHGMVYTRPRHVAESLHEMVYRAHGRELETFTMNQRDKGDAYMPAWKAMLAKAPIPFEVLPTA